MKKIKEVIQKLYYDVVDDFKKYPLAWLFIIWSARGKGKTYSLLDYCQRDKIPFIYIKRTIDDVELICSANKEGFDPSPFVPINRDKGTNIKARPIKKGLGAFYHCDADGDPIGTPIGLILALNAIKKFKGFDMSQTRIICFDEFIAQRGEIIRSGTIEGEQILDLYMTVIRDQQKRGEEPCKLVLFANSEEVSSPIANVLEVVDLMVDLNASGKTHYYDEERGIVLHHITAEEFPITENEKKGIFQAMKNTAWGQKAFEGEFSNNDFSNIVPVSIKKLKPYIHLHYKNNDYYIYINEQNNNFYMCKSQGKCRFEYDLNKENDQKLFHLNHMIQLRLACTEDRMKFQKYSMYDLIINYKKFFKL